MSQESELTNDQTVPQNGEQPGEANDVQALRDQLAQAQAQATECLDNWRRATADLSNARKRMQREAEEYRATAAVRVLEKLLPVSDDVNRAFENLPPEQAESDWINGFRMIQRKLDQLLESEGVTVIATGSQVFDPALHYAVTHEEAEGYTEGQIIGEVARGFTLGERVLRPSMVRVAK
ncbi:MAG: molecular chaperone GrpE [Chloroflexota bacterium]|nr:molecular chaperone GrpE [Chloroflexota bacterium]